MTSLSKYVGISEIYLVIGSFSLVIGWLPIYFLYFAVYGLTHSQAQFVLIPRWYHQDPQMFSGFSLKLAAIFLLINATAFVGILSYILSRKQSKQLSKRFLLTLKYAFLILLISSIIYIPFFLVINETSNPW